MFKLLDNSLIIGYGEIFFGRVNINDVEFLLIIFVFLGLVNWYYCINNVKVE